MAGSQRRGLPSGRVRPLIDQPDRRESTPSSGPITHTFGLEDSPEALQALAGRFPEQQPINVVMTPGSVGRDTRRPV